MKNILLFLLLAFYSLFSGQSDKLQGNWILDQIKYSDGSLLEVNHPLFSNFIEYQFVGNVLKINDQSLNVNISNDKISSNFRVLNYKLENDYLVINEEGDNKNYYFLKNDKFLKIYPEFEPKETEFENKKVFVTNSVVKPSFINSKNFDDFLRDNIPNYSIVEPTNNFFESKFILTKENKISDIKIINSISKKFDEQFTNALLISEKYFKNNSGKDLLITQQFNFFKMFNGLTNKNEAKLQKIYENGIKFFEKNDFQKAIKEYEKINNLNITPELKNRFLFTIESIYINLGISYLITEQKEKSCEAFKKVGDKTNFKVRNYLINFCE